jgi:renalase
MHAFAFLDPMRENDILIIGAGISGLLCATELLKAGYKACLVDKGRGVGGRMATRRVGSSRIDHGAQSFTVRDERFRTYVQEWLEAGVVREWYRAPSHAPGGEEDIHYCGTSGMSDAPKYLARQLEVHCPERIIKLARHTGEWIATSESGKDFRARELVITAPVPQALQLLDTANLDYAGEALLALRQLAYTKSLALLAILDGPSGLPFPGARKCQGPVVEWIADNYAKGISAAETAGITIHATAAFSREHWDSEDAARVPPMLAAVEHLLPSRIIAHQCHRWGFANAQSTWPETYFRNAALHLTLAGDAFGGPGIEAAAISGIEAAARIQQHRQKRV